jgi:hypothetical protein
MTSIDQFLGTYRPEIAALSRDLRRFIQSVAPDASEKLQSGWKCITYSHTKAFCSILPHANWVNLQFQSGSQMPDPHNLLEGTGKSMRHIKITRTEDINESLAELVRHAASLTK